MAKKKLTKQEVIKTWKQLDSKSEKPVGLKAVCNKMGIVPYHVTELFRGESMTEVKLRHKIRISPQEKPYTEDQLLEKYDSVVNENKRIPTWNQIRFAGGPPDSTFKKKFGSTQSDTVKAYQKWLQKNRPTSPNLMLVNNWLEGDNKVTETQAEITEVSHQKPISYKKNGERRTCGPPLFFRNLICEPINEQGVVFLFGMLSEELGFSGIEYIGTDFPDCEGKRLVSKGRRQQHVRIEFEYKSKEFVNHCHDPKECDLIVCWSHDWKNCPIDVIDLSKVIKDLKSTKK